MAFANGRPPMTAGPRPKPLPAQHKGYDEVAAKRIECQLGELGGRLNETQNTLAWLEGALDDGVSHGLVRRIKSLVGEAQSDTSRLLVEARKTLRPE